MPNSRFTLLIVFLSLLTLVGCRRSAVDRTLLKVDENGFISWEDGKRLILSGETRSVARTHARVVHRLDDLLGQPDRRLLLRLLHPLLSLCRLSYSAMTSSSVGR